MNKYDKFRDFCWKFRIVIGIVLIAIAIFTGNMWFYLGVIPLIAGITKFCPTCMISKKCSKKEDK